MTRPPEAAAAIRIGPVLAEAWALFRRDRDWLLALAGPFLFLPAFALALLVPPPPTATGAGEAQALDWARAVSGWAAEHGGWHLLAFAVACFGAAALYAAYLAAGDVRGALRRAGPILPRYLLAMLLIGLPTAAGLLLWVVPGLYVMGRAMLTGPALVAERPIGAAAAAGRSVRLTRGAGLPMAALASIPWLGGVLLAQPFVMLAERLREGGAGTLALALAGAGLAGVAAASTLAQALIAVAAYRRLSAR